jgi:ABC-type transport system involved in multi-copper enzyme maturation permease subunit
MIRSFRFQLRVLWRRKVLLITALTTAIFSIGAAALVLATATDDPTGLRGRGATIAGLTEAGGGTEVFTRGVSFTGTFLFVVFVGAFAMDFSRGTVRTMLLRQPRRLRLLAGKLLGLLAYAAVWLGIAEVLTWLAARVFAPGQDVGTAKWTSAAALGAAFADYATVLTWIAGYAVLAMTIGVLTRSVPIALGIGLAWSGPIEHLTQNAWPQAVRYFPGLLLEAFVAGGTPEVSASRALATVAAFVATAAAIGTVVFTRRDVTT